MSIERAIFPASSFRAREFRSRLFATRQIAGRGAGAGPGDLAFHARAQGAGLEGRRFDFAAEGGELGCPCIHLNGDGFSVALEKQYGVRAAAFWFYLSQCGIE